MKQIYVYPGSFCPPTYGHLQIAIETAKIFPQVTIICSKNPAKTNVWFSEAECQEMWKSYDLPENVKVTTFSKFTDESINPKNIVMIRGIRTEADLEEEKKVILLNRKMFNIDKYFYFFSKCEFEHISSSAARKLAKDLEFEKLSDYVSPLVISRLLERALQIKNLFMVVGPPGSGKSTFLKRLSEHNSSCVHINTDNFNEQLKNFLEKTFPGQDLIQLALEKEEELKRAIKKPWLKLLKQSLQKVQPESHVFVEIPYGLQKDKLMFRFMGGKILYIGCENQETLKSRLDQRGTPEIKNFIDRIPDKSESKKIAEQYKLSIHYIDTNCAVEKLDQKVISFNRKIDNNFSLKIFCFGNQDAFPNKLSAPSFLIKAHNHLILIDAPPNINLLLRQQGFSPMDLTAIIITHLHNDHVGGLIELIQLRMLCYAKPEIMKAAGYYDQIATGRLPIYIFGHEFNWWAQIKRLIEYNCPFQWGNLEDFHHFCHFARSGSINIDGLEIMYKQNDHQPPSCGLKIPEILSISGDTQYNKEFLDWLTQNVEIVFHEAGIFGKHLSFEKLPEVDSAHPNVIFYHVPHPIHGQLLSQGYKLTKQEWYQV